MNSNYTNINEVYPTTTPTQETHAPNTSQMYQPQYQNQNSNMNCQYQSTMNVPQPQYQTSYPNGIAPPNGSNINNLFAESIYSFVLASPPILTFNKLI